MSCVSSIAMAIAPLPLDLLDEGARRLAGLAAAFVVATIAIFPLQLVIQPQIAPPLDDPITRLVVLSALLIAAGLVALQRYRVVNSRTLLGIGMIFELAVALAMAMVETARPFDPSVPLLGLSAIGPWVVFVGAVIPSRPNVRLALALGAATTWPMAYWINATRFGFLTESWRHASIWPLMNYLLAIAAYGMGRWTYGRARDEQEAHDLGSYRLLRPIGE